MCMCMAGTGSCWNEKAWGKLNIAHSSPLKRLREQNYGHLGIHRKRDSSLIPPQKRQRHLGRIQPDNYKLWISHQQLRRMESTANTSHSTMCCYYYIFFKTFKNNLTDSRNKLCYDTYGTVFIWDWKLFGGTAHLSALCLYVTSTTGLSMTFPTCQSNERKAIWQKIKVLYDSRMMNDRHAAPTSALPLPNNTLIGK